MSEWVKMFNPRQQMAHGHCVQAFRECVDADEAARRLDDRRTGRVGLRRHRAGQDVSQDMNSLLSRWIDPNFQVVASTFDTHDFGFKWSYAEMALSPAAGYGLELEPQRH